MFKNVVQQTFALSQSRFGSVFSTPSANRKEEESVGSITRRLMSQLKQMHKFGLTNDSVNIRALQATSSDVQVAIELVFNGVVD